MMSGASSLISLGLTASKNKKINAPPPARTHIIAVHSFGKPEGEDGLQCYLGLEDAARDIERRMSIMIDAVDAAYGRSDDDPDVLKIFLAPEFFFRWKVSLSLALLEMNV